MFLLGFLFVLVQTQNCVNDLDCRGTRSLCANGRCFNTSCLTNQTICPFLNLSDTCFYRLCDKGSCITRTCTTRELENCTIRGDCLTDEDCVLGLCIPLLPCTTQSDCTRVGEFCSNGRCVALNCLDVPCLPVETGPINMDGTMIFTWLLLAAILLGIFIVCCCVRWKLRVR